MSENSANGSVEEVTENINVKSEIEDFDDYEERAKLIMEIRKMQKKIDRLRKKMADRYSKLHVPFKEVKDMHDDPSDDTVLNDAKRVRFCWTVELMFYGTIMKIDVTRQNSQITLFLTVPGKKTYALQFIKIQHRDLYNLDRCCLPYSINIIEEMEKANSFTIDQIIDYSYNIRKNIYAYYMREDQVQQFQTRVKNEKLYFNHDLGYTQVEIGFSIRKRSRESIDYRIKAIFYYDLLNTRPKKIIALTVDNDLEKEKQMKVQNYLLRYKHESLQELYDRIFAAQSPFRIL